MSATGRRTKLLRQASPTVARLVEWQPGEGWGPLCATLGLSIPDRPFPHVNSTGEFRARVLERR